MPQRAASGRPMPEIKLVQCVPNFSEGRRQEVVEALADSVRGTPKALLADYSADFDHNRCVLTFIGTPEAIREAVLAAARTAVELIDVSNHEGEHPRLGAVDVVPVVPLRNCTMDECVKLSRAIGEDLAQALNLPVYLYAESANHDHRVHLPSVRKGGFEALREKGLTGDRCPDYGPCELHPTAGAVVVGARGPLIAFNVNLSGANPEAAWTIAGMIRRQRSHDPQLAGVRAIGVALASRGLTQVSTNITKPHPTSMLDLYSYIAETAPRLGDEAVGAELIGTVRSEHLDPSTLDRIPNLALSPWQILDTWVDKYLYSSDEVTGLWKT